MRLDQYIAEMFNLTRSQAKKRIAEGCVLLNDEVVRKAGGKVRTGDSVMLTEVQESSHNYQLPITNYQSLEVLHDSPSCLVVNKPAGLTVHPSRTQGEPTLIEVLREQTGSPDLQLVHRLDKETSGCLLVAKTAKTHAALQRQFKNREVQKIYLAVVSGVPTEKKAVIEGEIGRSLMNRMKMSLFRTGKSRYAVTGYEVLKHSDDASLLRCDLQTGRTHQIRVHLRSIGHPILGDTKYGTEKSRELSKKLGVGRMLLHAWQLSFRDSEDRKLVEITADVPQALRAVIGGAGVSV
jgi:23S rRNA pseudouridine1911/1915/1917 synthase